MINLLAYLECYNPRSPHHVAAMEELAKHIPPEQLEPDADWVTIYSMESTELWNEPAKQSS